MLALHLPRSDHRSRFELHALGRARTPRGCLLHLSHHPPGESAAVCPYPQSTRIDIASHSIMERHRVRLRLRNDLGVGSTESWCLQSDSERTIGREIICQGDGLDLPVLGFGLRWPGSRMPRIALWSCAISSLGTQRAARATFQSVACIVFHSRSSRSLYKIRTGKHEVNSRLGPLLHARSPDRFMRQTLPLCRSRARRNTRARG